MSIIIKIYIYQKIGYLWLPWLLFKDGRHRNFVKMAAKISQRPLTRSFQFFRIYLSYQYTYNDGDLPIFPTVASQ